MLPAAEAAFTQVVAATEIKDRVAELGAAISDDYRESEPILVAVLVGALPFLADLARQLTIPTKIDFLSISRFGEGGRIRIVLDVADNLLGKDVIIVEDIVDTGLSLAVLRRMLLDRGANSVATVALLDKTTRRLVDVPLEYRGFEVGDEYLIGYGLDFEGNFRNLPSLWAVLDAEFAARDPAGSARYLYQHR
ncbi:MAG TPA: hypoxanthine phosphoribosyltransferase [Acidimicrobiia bacterium]|nr:hypoxanthine phosphoribosyltransferase [Acidimicrobiia bacterium]